tara:strand:+ start:1595 stop:1939 length:345 start_codon:yes stop_codon:yes gene_type:complete
MIHIPMTTRKASAAACLSQWKEHQGSDTCKKNRSAQPKRLRVCPGAHICMCLKPDSNNHPSELDDIMSSCSLPKNCNITTGENASSTGLFLQMGENFGARFAPIRESSIETNLD